MFIPAHRGATDEPAARRIESVFDGVATSLYAANRDFAYVDSQALCEAEVTDGVLTMATYAGAAGIARRRHAATESVGKRGRILAPRRCGDRGRHSPRQ